MPSSYSHIVVYTLWRLPGIIPLLHTIDVVVDKMRGGADLMTPGLTLGPPFPVKATKGAIVAIASYENPSVPVVVGECEIDVAGLTSVRGSKGHAVRGLHWHGDEIWSWSRNSRPGTDPPDRLEGWYEEQDAENAENAETRAAQMGVEDLDVNDVENDEDDGGVPINGTNSEKVEGEYVGTFDEAAKREWTTKGFICPGVETLLSLTLYGRDRPGFPERVLVRHPQRYRDSEERTKSWN